MKLPWPGNEEDITAPALARELASELKKEPSNIGKQIRQWLRDNPQHLPGGRRGLPDPRTHAWHLPPDLANLVRQAFGSSRVLSDL